MSIILYKKQGECWTEGRFEVPQMHHLLQNGWTTSIEESAEEEETINAEIVEEEEEEDSAPLLEDLPNSEIREIARTANIENWDDARIKTLVTKLRELSDGATEE